MEKKATEEKGIVLGFACPECGGNELMEIVEQGGVVHTPITEVIYYRDSGKAELDYDYDETWERTKFREYRYVCSDCKCPIEEGSEETLAEWLMENCPQPAIAEE